MPRIFIKQPNRPSASARDLARAMGVRMIRRTNSRYRSREGDVIINWGNPVYTIGGRVQYLNEPGAVRNAIDKRAAWALMREACVPTVEWTDVPQTARHWLEPGGTRVITRSTLRGSQGMGMEVYSYEGTEWTKDYNVFIHADQTPVYVKVFGRNPQHVTEYRVHVVDGQVIDYVQKKRRSNYEQGINPYIRSWSNGWVFARTAVVLPAAVNEAAVASVEALGLDFGAVDVAANRDGGACVYEVNTAPGIEGSTVGAYATALNARASS